MILELRLIFGHMGEAGRAFLDALSLSPEENLSESEQIAWRYTSELCREHRVGAELYAAAEAAFGQQGLVDMAILMGTYHLVCTLLNGFEVPVPA